MTGPQKLPYAACNIFQPQGRPGHHQHIERLAGVDRSGENRPGSPPDLPQGGRQPRRRRRPQLSGSWKKHRPMERADTCTGSDASAHAFSVGRLLGGETGKRETIASYALSPAGTVSAVTRLCDPSVKKASKSTSGKNLAMASAHVLLPTGARPSTAAVRREKPRTSG